MALVYLYAMKKEVSLLKFLLILGLGIGLFACDGRQPEKANSEPQVFSPETEGMPQTKTDSLSSSAPAKPEISSEPMPEPRKMPTVEELKKVTPSQEAKRALSTDAMKAYRMKPEEFSNYMKTRVAYYRGKGELKAENDVVKIEITASEMLIETPKGRQVFPMK